MRALIALAVTTILTLPVLAEGREETGNAGFDIYAFQQPFRLGSDLDGSYGDLLKYLIRESRVPLRVHPNVVARSIRNFANDPDGCFFPTSPMGITQLAPELQGRDFIVSLPIDHVSSHIFWRDGAREIHSLNDTRGLSIGMLQTVSKQPSFARAWRDHGVSPVPVPSDLDAIKLLARGRVNHIAGWVPDTLIQFNAMGFSDYEYDRDFHLIRLTTHIVCHYNENTAALVADLNRAIMAARKSGLMRELFPAPERPATADEKATSSWPINGLERTVDVPMAGWIFRSGALPVDIFDNSDKQD